MIIAYCVPYEYSTRALKVAEELVKVYQHIINQLVLIMDSKGVFEVKVGNELIYSKKFLKRRAKPGEDLELFKAFVGIEVPSYSYKAGNKTCVQQSVSMQISLWLSS